ncbi:MAG: hypothetical protein U0744_07050 [Gemmataceae bacterium]
MVRPPSINNDGSRIAFVSNATDLTATDSNGTTADVFVFDRTGAATVALISEKLRRRGHRQQHTRHADHQRERPVGRLQ